MKIKELLKKYEGVISYLFFGVCTTLVNVVVYGICSKIWHLSTVGSTFIAWILAVIFAYITNRKWVFKSKAHRIEAIIKEVFSFFVCRLLTGFLDIAVMYIFVDLLHFEDMIMKMLSNVLVVVVNYIASKFVIFKSGTP